MVILDHIFRDLVMHWLKPALISVQHLSEIFWSSESDVPDGVVSGVSHTRIGVLSGDVFWPWFVFFKGFKLGTSSTEVLTWIVIGPSNHWVRSGSISSRHFYKREDGSG